MTTPPPSDPFGAPSTGRPGEPSYGQPSYGQPSYGPRTGGGPGPHGAQDTRTEPKAIVAIVLAVLAWTPTVPFIGAIAALVLARSAERDIAASGGILTGRSLCTWARVMSWVHLVVVALAVLAGLLLLVLPVAVSL